MRTAFPAVIALALSVASNLHAQSGVIVGVVRDSSGLAVPGVDISLVARRRSVVTDSLGRFTFAGLANGGYVIVTRKLGWAPETWDAQLRDGGTVKLEVVLRRRSDLDTVHVIADATCPRGVVGFVCRQSQRAPTTMILDYPEVDAYGWLYAKDLRKWVFLDARQFWTERFGRSFKFCGELLDGRAIDVTNPMPRLSMDIVGIEVYPSIDSIPGPRRERARAGITSRANCGVIMYWSIYAPLEQPKNRIRALPSLSLGGV